MKLLNYKGWQIWYCQRNPPLPSGWVVGNPNIRGDFFTSLTKATNWIDKWEDKIDAEHDAP